MSQMSAQKTTRRSVTLLWVLAACVMAYPQYWVSRTVLPQMRLCVWDRYLVGAQDTTHPAVEQSTRPTQALQLMKEERDYYERWIAREREAIREQLMQQEQAHSCASGVQTQAWREKAQEGTTTRRVVEGYLTPDDRMHITDVRLFINPESGDTRFAQGTPTGQPDESSHVSSAPLPPEAEPYWVTVENPTPVHNGNSTYAKGESCLVRSDIHTVTKVTKGSETSYEVHIKPRTEAYGSACPNKTIFH